MTEEFKYWDLLRCERPRHGRLDAFSMRHPPMDAGRRAKIFAPFDALRGFRFAILTAEAEQEMGLK